MDAYYTAKWTGTARPFGRGQLVDLSDLSSGGKLLCQPGIVQVYCGEGLDRLVDVVLPG